MTDISLLPSACHDGIGTPDYIAYAARYPAYTLPYRRFADVLANTCARLGTNVDRYSFIAVDLHHLLLAGLPALSLTVRPAHARGHQFVTCYLKASAISFPCVGLFLSGTQIWHHCFSFFVAWVVGLDPGTDARDFVTIKGGTRHRTRRLAVIQPCIR